MFAFSNLACSRIKSQCLVRPFSENALPLMFGNTGEVELVLFGSAAFIISSAILLIGIDFAPVLLSFKRRILLSKSTSSQVRFFASLERQPVKIIKARISNPIGIQKIGASSQVHHFKYVLIFFVR